MTVFIKSCIFANCFDSKMHVIVHPIKIGIILLLVVMLAACRDPKLPIGNSGSIVWHDTSYALMQARVSCLGDLRGDGLHTLMLSALGENISMNGITTSGYGAFITLAICDSMPQLRDGIYDLAGTHVSGTVSADSAVFVVWPQSNVGDSVLRHLTAGFLQVKSVDAIRKQLLFRFIDTNGDSVSGSYVGTVVYNNQAVADSVGYVEIDTLHYALRRAEMVIWGPIFLDGSNYYEYYFYPTDMLHTDGGALATGNLLIVGLQSAAGDGPATGVYPLSRIPAEHTALVGQKFGKAYWGTYWTRFANGNVIGRANITKDSVTIVHNGSHYDIAFDCRDQLGNRIRGHYSDEVIWVLPQ